MNKPKFTRNGIQATMIASGIKPEQARTLTDRIIKAMTAALAAGKVIELRGFGTLVSRTHKARTAHNPRTMAPVNVPARRVIFFKPSSKLKKALAFVSFNAVLNPETLSAFFIADYRRAHARLKSGCY